MKFFIVLYLLISIQNTRASGHDGYESEQLRNVKRTLILGRSNDVLCDLRRQGDGSQIAFGNLKLSLFSEQFKLDTPVESDCRRILALAQSIAQGLQVKAIANFILSREFLVDSYSGRPKGRVRLTCTVLLDIGQGLSFAQFSKYITDAKSCQ